MGLKNKAKKLNTELLILKVSVLLSSPKHIRRWMKRAQKSEKIYLQKSFVAGRDISLLIFLIHAFYEINFLIFIKVIFGMV